MTGGPALHAPESWLPFLLPADARTFRVADPWLALVLADAGAELVDAAPDVEIGTPLRGDAGLGVVELGYPRFEGGRLGAAADRVLRSAQAWMRGRSALRQARRAYDQAALVRWDVARTLPRAGVFPRRVLVVARSTPPAETLLQRVVQETQVEAVERANLREGFLLVPARGGILRVAVGPGRREPLAQRRALEALAELRPGARLAARVPWVEAAGLTGLAEWTLERRLPGAPRRSLPPAARVDALDVLADLHGLDGGPPTSCSADAERIAELLPEAAAVRELAPCLDRALADHPRRFAHGDYWQGNLLFRDGRLAGVIDWASAGPGRPALLDLLHLRLMAERRPGGHEWGRAVVDELLPLARAGDAELAGFARRVRVELTPARLLALVGAYWLDRLRYQLETYGDRRRRPRWLENNVGHVLRELGPEVG